ncbi:phosphatase PAP2 family protein [Pendulispora albinea]|uniref:Phosphatase PAP2 family protein n=1 Tax=Pendulispora albinea TaxID=2741071 RepID=A0ABZ2LZL8_9BACT
MAHPVHADSSSPRIDVALVPDGAVIVGSLLGTLAMSRLPVAKGRWREELLPFDLGTRGVSSGTHADISNGMITSTLALPVLAEVVRGDADRLSKGVVYGEAMAIGAFLNAVAKFTVQRPRPYTYSTNPSVVRYAAREGNESYISFYSGHATTAFAAAVSGSYLFAYGNPNTGSRALIWGLEMAFASATATGRVRAGKHFPTDVVVGAAVGTGIGILVPRAHMSDRSAVALEPAEWAAISGGLLLGTAAIAFLPAFATKPAPRSEPLGGDPPTPARAGATWAVVPTFAPSGAGFSVRGTF